MLWAKTVCAQSVACTREVGRSWGAKVCVCASARRLGTAGQCPLRSIGACTCAACGLYLAEAVCSVRRRVSMCTVLVN